MKQLLSLIGSLNRVLVDWKSRLIVKRLIFCLILLLMAYSGYGGYGVPMAGQPMHGGYPAPQNYGVPMAGQPMHGGYPSPHHGAQPMVGDQMWGYFSAVAGHDGEVDADELQRCLTQAGFTGTYTPFNLETCRIMIAMLDRDYSGKMGFNEFKELFTALNGWKQNFIMVDHDRSGTVEPHELSQAINNMGYRLSPQALNIIIKHYSRNGKISFDDYVACCVKLRTLTDQFRSRDTMQQGSVTFHYDDFIQCTMAI
ncbi:sorcin isoform X2 [Thalassophryne amazonica]|uniref:sorcin isoform X2 n=1 Tax=Thalassophryne amazonica TaxID=390379 RepID=UPI0014723CB1|nr:sorcin isoform X2 [Thalassophryne amazonica]